MQRKNIEFDLQNKVRKYINFLAEKNSADAEIEKELIGRLNNSLREEVLIRANGIILKKIPFFSKNFTERTLRRLVFVMKQTRFYPEETIYEV